MKTFGRGLWPEPLRNTTRLTPFALPQTYFEKREVTMSEQTANKGALDMMIQYFRDFKVLKETRREYWGTQIVNFLDCTLYFAMISIAAVFLSEDLGMSDTNAGYVITIFTSATTIFLFFSGMFTDWLGIRRSIYISMFGLLALRLGVGLIGLFPDLVPERGIVAGVLFFLMAPFMAMTMTVYQAANKRYTTKHSRSAGFNLWYLFMNIGAAAGGFLIDIVRKLLGMPNSYIFIFGVVTAVLAVLTTLLMVRSEEQLRADDEEPEEAKPKEKKEKKNPLVIAKEVVVHEAFWRLTVLITLLLGVRAVFLYMYLLMPKYWLRVIGPDAAIGTLQAINPILIVIGLVLFIPITNKFNIFSMLVYGAMISAFSLVPLALPWQVFGGDMANAHYVMSFVCLVILSLGELVWSPKLSEYTAAVAPEGQEGTYMGLTMVPYFLAKTIISLLSGHMLIRWVPEGIGEQIKTGTVAFADSPAMMWTVLAGVALAGPVIALIFRGWFTKGARWSGGKDLHG